MLAASITIHTQNVRHLLTMYKLRRKNMKRNFTNLQNCSGAVVRGGGGGIADLAVVRTVQLRLKQLDQVLKAEQIAVVGADVSGFVLKKAVMRCMSKVNHSNVDMWMM